MQHPGANRQIGFVLSNRASCSAIVTAFTRAGKEGSLVVDSFSKVKELP